MKKRGSANCRWPKAGLEKSASVFHPRKIVRQSTGVDLREKGGVRPAERIRDRPLGGE